MTDTRSVIRVTVAAVLLATSCTAAVAGSIKCWTNNEGVKECGNVVPPEYAQQGHNELNEQGITTNTTARAKTAEELAAEKETERLALEQAKLSREQQAKDRVLLDTFTTEEDLILARDGKLRAIDTRINHTQQVSADLSLELDSLESEAASQERSGTKLDEKLIQNITAVQALIEQNNRFISDREREKDVLRAKFEEDLTRYRELKGQ